MRELCTPSKVYFGFSMFLLIVMAIQNMGGSRNYHIGSYSCYTPSVIIVFVFKFAYILFWTWILNLICKDGQKNIAWFLVILPVLLLFVIIGVFVLM